MNKIKNLFILLFIIKGIIMSNMVSGTPFFGVDIDLNNVGVDIRINDIPTYFDEEKGQLKVEIASPESIINGINSLQLSISLPYDGDERVNNYHNGAYATATLFQQDLSVNGSDKIKLLSATLKISGDEVLISVEEHSSKEKSTSKTLLSKDGRASVEVTTNINSPFPVWAWQDGQVIENNEDNFNTLLAAYKEIHSTLSAKDLKKLKELYRFRAQEIAIAYGLSGESAGHDKLSTGKDMNNPNLELYDFHTDGMKLDIIGNGRLARISDQDHDQPILYYEAKPSLLHLYKFIFFLNKENKWIMIR